MTLASSASASAAVLHDQLDNSSFSGVTIDSSTKSPNADVRLADDFVVPSGKVWRVDSVEVTSSGANDPADYFNVFFYPNAGTLPQEAAEYARVATGDSGLEPVFVLNPPAVLPAGRHWLSIQGYLTQASKNWYWKRRAVQTGFAAAFRGGGCPTWKVRADCVMDSDNPDELFKISGTESNAPPPSGGGSVPDTVSPAFTGKAAASPSTFAIDPKGPAEQPVSSVKKGTTFTYSLSEAAKVTFTIQRRATGRKVGRKCRRPTHRNRKKKRCTRYTRFGAFRAQGSAGANRKSFSGKIGRRKLRPGRYRALLVAVDAAGNRSKAKSVRFRVVKAGGKRR